MPKLILFIMEQSIVLYMIYTAQEKPRIPEKHIMLPFFQEVLFQKLLPLQVSRYIPMENSWRLRKINH